MTGSDFSIPRRFMKGTMKLLLNLMKSVVLADYVDKHRDIDIPIYPVYYSKKKRVIEIGKSFISHA